MREELSLVINSFFTLNFLMLPLLLTLIIYLFRKEENIRDFFVVIISLILVFLSIEIYFSTNLSFIYITNLFQIIKNVNFAFIADASSVVFFLVISILWFLTSIYSIGYMRSLKEHGQSRFYACFALSIFATIGVCFSKNLLTLFIFYEILSLATYPLVTHHKDNEAIISGRKYLGFILGGSVGLVFPAMIFIYLKTGSLEFTSNGIMQFSGLSSTTIFILLLMLVFGFSKAAVMPLHAWLPNAMVAPTPVSALLHAVAVVKVGVFSIYRVVGFIFGTKFLASKEIFGVGINTFFCIIAAITILVGALFAICQDNLKKRLAYSTISQLSYILLGIFVLNPLATGGALFYLVIHAFAKITLFYIVGLILVTTGKTCLSEIRGLGYKMPFAFICFFVASLSLIGIPPAGGFLAKYMLLEGALWENKAAFIVVYLCSSFLAAMYLLPVVFEAFKKDEEDALFRVKRVPLSMAFSIFVTTSISVLLFFYSDVITSIIFRAIHQMTVMYF